MFGHIWLLLVLWMTHGILGKCLAEALKAIEGMDGVKFQASVLTICSDSGQMCVTLGIRYYRYGRGSKPYHPWSIRKHMQKCQVVLGHSSIHSQEARIKPLICTVTHSFQTAGLQWNDPYPFFEPYLWVGELTTVEGGQGRHINQGLQSYDASKPYLSFLDAGEEPEYSAINGQGWRSLPPTSSEYVQSDGCFVESWQPASRAQARIWMNLSHHVHNLIQSRYSMCCFSFSPKFFREDFASSLDMGLVETCWNQLKPGGGAQPGPKQRRQLATAGCSCWIWMPCAHSSNDPIVLDQFLRCAITTINIPLISII